MLGDRIAILAEGKLRCCGSSLFLKNRFGAGYRLVMSRKIGTRLPATEIVKLVQKTVPGAQMLTDVGAEVTIQLPTESASQFPLMFEQLNAQLRQLEIENYGLSQATLEEIFLKIASNEDLEDSPAPAVAAPVSAAIGDSLVPQSEGVVILRHYAAMFCKRVHYGRRDWRSLACVTVFPVGLLIMGLALLKLGTPPTQPVLPMTVKQFDETTTPVPFNESFSYREKPWHDALQHMAHKQGVTPITKRADAAPTSTGKIFGVNYTAGIYCNIKCPKLEKPKPLASVACPVWKIALPQLAQVGVGVTCGSTKSTCLSVVASTCADNQAKCVQQCADDSNSNLPAELCHDNCKCFCTGDQDACSAAGISLPTPLGLSLSTFCNVSLPENGTLGSMCKSLCGTCPDSSPDTTCVSGYKEYDVDSPMDSKLMLGMMRDAFNKGLSSTAADVTYGTVLMPRSVKDKGANLGIVTSLLFNTTAHHALPVYINLANDALKKAADGKDTSSITCNSHPFPLSRFYQEVINSAVALAATLFIMIAFAFVPAVVVSFIVKEREAHHNSKHQQMISGASIPAYWLANYTWDLLIYVLPCAISIIVIHIFNIGAFTGTRQASEVVVLLFVGYGFAIMPFTYILSFLFKSHTKAQLWCLLLNLLSGLVLMLASYIMSFIDDTKDTNKALIWLYRLFPGFCLGNGLFNVATQSLITTFVAQAGGAVHVDLYDMDICGKDLWYLYICAPLYFLIVCLVDTVLNFPAIAQRISSDIVVQDPPFAVDEDVAAEAARIDSTSPGEPRDVVRLRQLRKVYRASSGAKVAVRSLSFGMPKGECFGFLGINGAGKTSTLNMLTGAVLPTSGDAWLAGKHILHEQQAVRRLIGYCPQHDALLDLLSVTEHIQLFGRLKGIPEAELPALVQTLIERLDLQNHAHKLAHTLSGGNKRKLSVAIALIGSPQLVFLDEPSTGVDPGARRFMWSVISQLSTLSKSCSVVLTTHVMEEAEALCGRIGIMVGGRLRCLGSGQHLKSRFGQGYQLELRLQAPTAQEGEELAARYQLPAQLPPSELYKVCAAMGDGARCAEIAEEGSGHIVHHSIQAHGAPSTLCPPSLLSIPPALLFISPRAAQHARCSLACGAMPSSVRRAPIACSRRSVTHEVLGDARHVRLRPHGFAV
jgi:ABC-type multidrug transport system ATPase subunit